RQGRARTGHREDPGRILRHRQRTQPQVPPLAHAGRGPAECRCPPSLTRSSSRFPPETCRCIARCPRRSCGTRTRACTCPSRRPAKRAAPTAARCTNWRVGRPPTATKDSLSLGRGPGRGTVRILVIAPSWVGDAVLTHPLLVRLKERDPSALIDVLAPTWAL